MKKLIVLLFHFILMNSSLADDTEIYVGDGTTSAEGVRPNVLFMLDTSGSMTNKDGGDITRLDRMKEALRTIISQSNNVNMGLMRFHKEGGPILYPVTNINESLEVTGDSESEMVIQIAGPSDDAEEHIASGDVVVTDTELEMIMVPAGGGATPFSSLVVSENDDAEEASDGDMYRDSSDLELMNDGNNRQKIGIRFQNTQIPAGAVITSASIEFQLDRETNNDESLTIKILAHKVPDSASFSSNDYDISNRIGTDPTTASVLWSPETGVKKHEFFETNDLSAVVQEIVNQSEWSTGNPITFLLQLENAGNGGIREVGSFSDGNDQPPKLKVSYTTGGTSGEQKIGLRFQEVMIPKGAVISSAVVEFESALTQSDAASLIIKGEDVDDSSMFESITHNISSRALTSSSVAWNSIPQWTAGERYQTPDLSNIIQEQVDREGWCGGQSLSLIVSGLSNSLRKVKSYDSSSTAAPVLRISYDKDSIPEDTCFHQVIQDQISNADDDVEQSADGDMSFGSSDLELVRDGGDQTIGLRFSNLAIPKDTTIIKAELLFSNDISEPQSDPVTLTIKGENVDDSSVFLVGSSDLTDRVTTGNVSWTPEPWGETPSWYPSADISSIVQTIVNRAGWESGNAMTFVVSGSGSEKRVANSLDGSASLATRLRIVVGHDVDIPLQTVRNKLLETVDNLHSKSGTPILDVLYEAALYYRGEDVLYGRTRGFGELIGDGTLGDNSSSNSQYTRVSHPLSWNGDGTIVNPDGCTEDNPNSTNCIDQHIDGAATYISPVEESCQANYQILLSDGQGYGENSVNSVNSMMTDASVCSGHDACAEALSGFLHTVDQSNSFDDLQTVATYTIGFNLEATNPEFLQDIADAGGGSFHTADTAAELADVFQTILSEVLAKTSSFSAPTVSLNAFTKLFHDDDIYFSTFLPDRTGRWAGNLKKYKICEEDGESTCTEDEILDSNGSRATSASGQFLDSSKSFWSLTVDGKDVQQGGAGSKINYSDAPRKIYIENGDQFVLLTESSADVTHADYDASLQMQFDQENELVIDNGDGTLTDSGYLNLIQWLLGKDVRDEDDDASIDDDRWAFSDALHSQPLVITYGIDSSGADDVAIKKIFIGTNDGLLHMINAENGKEEWSFMPSFMVSRQKHIMANTNGDHISGVDGNIRSWVIDHNNNGIIEPDNTDGHRDKVYLYFSMRRGGRQVYAIDVTPAATLNSVTTGNVTPMLLWKIEGGITAGFEALGQTWSTPQLDKIWYGSTTDGSHYPIKKDVIMFAGGYHPEQDTTYGPSAYGNAIYIVDALTGELLWRAVHSGTLNGDNGVEFDDMQYPIPSDLALIDTNADGATNRLYVGDTGGQVWRIDLEAKSINSGGVNGSGVKLADISGRDAFGVVAAENKRKFFYVPDVALVNDFSYSSKAAFDLLVMVSGDRSSPNDKSVHDRIYMLRDYAISSLIYDADEPFTALTESDLYDATENLIQDSDGKSNSEVASDQVALLREKDGWSVSLVEGTNSWIGEKGLSEPVILNGLVFLTTFLPSGELNEDDLCGSPAEGSGRVYALNVLNAAAFFPEWDGHEDAYDRDDRVYDQTLYGIPSQPVIRRTKKGPKLLIGGGGGIISIDPKIGLKRHRSYWKEL